MSPATVRFYESEGLINPLLRSQSGQRVFDKQSIERLHFIRNARNLGFSLTQVRSLLSLLKVPEAPCVNAQEIAVANLTDVRARIQKLELLERELQSLVDGGCDSIATNCRIIEALTIAL